MSDLKEIKLKGSVINTAIKNIISKYGEDKHEEALNLISEDAKKVLSSLIVDAGWYSTMYYEEYLDKITQLLFDGDKDKAIERAKTTAIENFSKGIYKILVKIGSPKFILSKATEAGEKFVRGIELKATDIKDKSASLEYNGFPKELINYELATFGFDWGAIEASGGRNVKGEIVQSCANGMGKTIFKYTWE